MLRTTRLLTLAASATFVLGMFAGGTGTAGASPWDLPDLPEVDPCVFLPGGCEPAPDPDPDPVPAFPIPDDIAIPDPCWFNPECGPIDPGDPGDDTPDGDDTPETTPDTPDTPDGDSPSTESSVQTAAPAVVVNASPNFTG